MPLIEVKVLEGVFSNEQKQQMIAKFTDTMVELEGEHMRPVTTVLIEEVASGCWGIGGKGYTTAEVKAMKAKK